MDKNHDVRRTPNAALRWVLRGLCIVAGAGIAWMLAAAVSNASPITDTTPKSLSSSATKQLTQAKKQLTQTTKEVTKTTSSVVNTTTSKAQKTVAPIAPKPVQNSIDKVTKIVNQSVGHTTNTVAKIVDKPASTIGEIVPSTPVLTPTDSNPQVPAGNLNPDPGPAPPLLTPDTSTLSMPLLEANNDIEPFKEQLVTGTNPVATPNASHNQHEPQTSFQNVVATITNSVNFNSAGIAGILTLAVTVLLGFLYLGMFRELRGGVVKRPYLVPVTPD